MGWVGVPFNQAGTGGRPSRYWWAAKPVLVGGQAGTGGRPSWYWWAARLVLVAGYPVGCPFNQAGTGGRAHSTKLILVDSQAGTGGGPIQPSWYGGLGRGPHSSKLVLVGWVGIPFNQAGGLGRGSHTLVGVPFNLWALLGGPIQPSWYLWVG